MKLRLSPAGVLAVIALVVALGGTAIAAGVFTPEERKQIGRIATKVFDERIGEASVNHARSADLAGRAETAINAETAVAAKQANHAVTADRAAEATSAGTAGDAAQLGGQPAASYQRALTNGCAPGSAIASIAPQGQVTCSTQSVQGIRIFAFQQERKTVPLANGLTVVVSCADNLPSWIELVNTTAENINVNYFALRTGSSKVAGEILAPGQRHEELVAPRLEGQFIWMTSAGVTTLSLHTFERGNFCEVTGTAVTAFG